MAISALTQFEVRTTGADTNGGGFVAGASGTDYSTQDAAQSSGTNLVVDATTNTKVTSASHNFVATDVGNLIQITAGSGWTTGFYQVVSVASNAATLDRSPAATSTTGGTWALGGGLATIAKALTGWAVSNIIWVKKGTYTKTSLLTITGADSLSSQPPYMILGYNVTHGDNPTGSNRPTLRFTAVDSGVYITTGADNIQFANFIVDGNGAGTNGVYINGNNPAYGTVLTNVRVTNWTLRGLLCYGSYPADFVRCEVDSMAAGAVAAATGLTGWSNFIDCEIHDNACDGISLEGTGANQMLVLRCNIYRNTGTTSGHASCGIYWSGSTFKCIAKNCTIYGNAGDGLAHNITYFAAQIRNNIFSQNGGYGLNILAQNVTRPDVDYNFFYSNTSGARNGAIAGAHDVTLTADPFTNASLSANGAADFSLNTTAGGGAAVRAAGYPGVSPSGNSTGYLDGGAYQHADPAGGGGGMLVHPGMAGGPRG